MDAALKVVHVRHGMALFLRSKKLNGLAGSPASLRPLSCILLSGISLFGALTYRLSLSAFHAAPAALRMEVCGWWRLGTGGAEVLFWCRPYWHLLTRLLRL